MRRKRERFSIKNDPNRELFREFFV